jgi:tRNA (guanosine-2'-O-)-methyltransferase
MNITSRRREKFKKVAYNRQLDLALVLENISDMHNTGAVLRTCDAVGVGELVILNTDEELHFKNYTLGKRTTSGARKWVEVKFYTCRDTCFQYLRSRYKHIFATHLNHTSKSIYETDFSGSCAIVFGNEKDGISLETLKQTTGNILIPMIGMVQSLNISVACAITLYEVYRQRLMLGQYPQDEIEVSPSIEHRRLYEQYLNRHQDQSYNKKLLPED